MRRSSTDRGQTEPFAAIVAVFAVVVGIVAYSGVLGGAVPGSDRDVARTTLPQVRSAVSTHGVVEPVNLSAGTAAAPAGHRLNLTLSTDDGVWHEGPPAPTNADEVTGSVSVRVGPGDVRPGELRVVVWR